MTGELQAATVNHLVERVTDGTITSLLVPTEPKILFGFYPQTPMKQNTLSRFGSIRRRRVPTNSSLENSSTAEKAASISSNSIAEKPTLSRSRTLSRVASILGSRLRSGSVSASNNETEKEPTQTKLPNQPENPEITNQSLENSSLKRSMTRRRGGIQHTHEVNACQNDQTNTFVVREAGESFEKIFLLTFGTFVTGKEFMKKLMERFEVPAHVDPSLKRRIQIHVCQLLIRWVATFPLDFNGQMVAMLNNFLFVNEVETESKPMPGLQPGHTLADVS